MTTIRAPLPRAASKQRVIVSRGRLPCMSRVSAGPKSPTVAKSAGRSRCAVVGPKCVLKVFIVGDVLDLVEIVPQPLLIKAVVDEVGSTSMAIRTKGVDQVAIGCDVLQAIKCADPLLVKPVGQVMQFPGMAIRTEGSDQIVIGGDVGQRIKRLGGHMIVDRQITDLVERLGMKIRLTLQYG